MPATVPHVRSTATPTNGSKVVAIVLSILTLSAMGATPAGAAEQVLTIRAVGDSYASGEGARGRDWLDDGSPDQHCHRSHLAAPAEAVRRLSLRRVTSFQSFACSGAATTNESDELLDVGRQLSRLPRDRRIDALTIAVGGNDVHFARIVQGCMSLSNCAMMGVEVAPLLEQLPEKLQGLLDQVPENVTDVFVTEYPDPTTGWDGNRCGSFWSPAFGLGMEHISEDEARWASQKVLTPLNAALSQAVDVAERKETGRQHFHFVTGISERFATHGYCTGGGSPAPWTLGHPRFISTLLDSISSQGDGWGTMHPNDLGQRAIADVLFEHTAFLTEPLRLQVRPASRPVVGFPVALEASVSTSRGTPVSGATVRVDGVPIGQTDRNGHLRWESTFQTPRAHTVTVDHDPYPVATASVWVRGRDYTVTADPTPIPIGRSVLLTLRAADVSGELVEGTFRLASGSGIATIRSGASATVNLAARHEVEWIDRPNGKPPRKVIRVICPSIQFAPDDARFDSKDVSNLVACDDV